MAIQATAIWRVRVSGSDLNGAAYDPSIASAGTDYSQQDAAQLSLTDLTSTASTTITSVTGGFTAAMIGNALRISSGTGATVGYYFITAVGSTNSITVDRASGTYTTGVGRVGGGAATISRVGNSANASGDAMVGGNICYIRGSGSDDPTSADYTYTTNFTPVTGSVAAGGYVKFIGENGRPRFNGSGYDLFLHHCNGVWLENVYVQPGSAATGYALFCDGTECIFKDCVIDLNDLAVRSIYTGTPGTIGIYDCEIFSVKTGTPTTQSGLPQGFDASGGSTGSAVFGNVFHNLGGDAVNYGNGLPKVFDNLFLNIKGNALIMSNGDDIHGGNVHGNVFDQIGGDAIQLANANAIATKCILNNILSNVTGTAINAQVGSTALNDRLKKFIDYNAFYNNGANYANMSAGANDQILGATPYTQGNTPTTDWSGNSSVWALGFPKKLRDAAGTVNTTAAFDIGVQHNVALPPAPDNLGWLQSPQVFDRTVEEIYVTN